MNNLKNKCLTYNVDFYAKKNNFKLLAFIIDQCNYRCEYCYNVLPRTNKRLNLDKLYYFVSKILIGKLQKQYLELELIGGEPTLHPDLLRFCERIAKIKNIHTTIYTNFSSPIEYYKKLIGIDSRITLILSWHTSNKQFMQKLALFSKEILENNITVSVIYEHNNINKALEIFDHVHMNYSYVRELSFPLIDNNANYENKYNEQSMVEYNKRLKFVKDLTRIKIQYTDNTSEIVDQHYFIVDDETRNYKYWLCNAGIDFCFIYLNSDICICDAYRNVKLGNLDSSQLDNFKLNVKPKLCGNTCCPCVFDVKKTAAFKHLNEH